MKHTPVRHAAVDQLRFDEAVVQPKIERGANAIVTIAQELAPKKTGAGAASIHSEPRVEGGAVVGRHVSWDREHDYMKFAEYGTENEKPRPFLRPAVDIVTSQHVE